MKTTTETFTEITLTGTYDEVQIFTAAARKSGRLVWASAPRLLSSEDPRYVVKFRFVPTQS